MQKLSEDSQNIKKQIYKFSSQLQYDSFPCKWFWLKCQISFLSEYSFTKQCVIRVSQERSFVTLNMMVIKFYSDRVSVLKKQLRAVKTVRKAGINDFTNLRPVSNLQYVSKLVERAVFDQVHAHLSEHDLCKERFCMNSLFGSNIIYSFQIFALMLFLVIHAEFA